MNSRLPHLIFLDENHQNSLLPEVLRKLSPKLKEKGYAAYYDEAPNQWTLEETISLFEANLNQIRATISTIELLYKEVILPTIEQYSVLWAEFLNLSYCIAAKEATGTILYEILTIATYFLEVTASAIREAGISDSMLKIKCSQTMYKNLVFVWEQQCKILESAYLARINFMKELSEHQLYYKAIDDDSSSKNLSFSLGEMNFKSEDELIKLEDKSNSVLKIFNETLEPRNTRMIEAYLQAREPVFGLAGLAHLEGLQKILASKLANSANDEFNFIYIHSDASVKYLRHTLTIFDNVLQGKINLPLGITCIDASNMSLDEIVEKVIIHVEAKITNTKITNTKTANTKTSSSSTSKLLSSLNSANVVSHHSIESTGNLRGLSTPSSGVAWASGYNGSYLKTTNHGKNWECSQIPDAESLQFRDIKAFDENTAYIMSSGSGASSRIYKTINGGQSWQLQLMGSDSQEFFNCMAFWNRDRGMVLGDPINGKFKLYITENGGATWQANPELGMPLALEKEGAFAASGSCMTTCGELDAWFGTGVNAARVFHTSDGGKSWQVANTPIMQSSVSAGIFSIAFYDVKNGVIAGGDYANPERGGSNLAITQDGGLSWELAALSPQFYWSAVSYTNDGQDIMLVGNKQVGLTTSKSPQRWKESWNINGLNTLSFWAKGKALAAGEKDLIVEFDMPGLR
jgi:photosystem II stability/assembly factor-like uncharacterized protein